MKKSCAKEKSIFKAKDVIEMHPQCKISLTNAFTMQNGSKEMHSQCIS